MKHQQGCIIEGDYDNTMSLNDFYCASLDHSEKSIKTNKKGFIPFMGYKDHDSKLNKRIFRNLGKKYDNQYMKSYSEFNESFSCDNSMNQPKIIKPQFDDMSENTESVRIQPGGGNTFQQML